jgi:mannose-1-phosphate guanylyltransferase/mannose-6-phosphate isomerase
MKIIPVILSGGMGTRLWPISRQKLPKQFLKLINDESSFCKISKLASAKKWYSEFIVIANSEHRFLVAEELLENNLHANQIILEPESRNTCPAIAAAAFYAKEDDVLLVMPSDQIMAKPEIFHEAIQKAYKYAEQGAIVTFGIKPTFAATGYGYIKAQSNHDDIKKVEKFIEKPALEIATEYFKNGEYLWNAGIFMFKAKTFLEQLKKFKPEIYANVHASLYKAEKDYDFLRLNAEAFAAAESISIDYAIMDKANNIMVCEIDCGWRDIGDWKSLSDAGEKDTNGNNLIGDVIADNTENSYLHSEDGLLVASGLKNVVVFKTRDVALVADKSQAQNIKAIAEKLKHDGRSEYENHYIQHKPWGSFEIIKTSAGYKIKRIVVKPNCQLSMQKHEQRTEHWVVISGKAEVQCNEKTFILEQNQSTFIPLNAAHRLKNASNEPLVMIEIQTGSYLEEDDIIRLHDDWGRDKTYQEA